MLSLVSTFPDFTLCGNAELRDNNQVQVAPFQIGKNRREAVVGWVNSSRLRVQYISLGVQFMYYQFDTD